VPDWQRTKREESTGEKGEGKKNVARRSLALPINDSTIYLSRRTPATADEAKRTHP